LDRKKKKKKKKKKEKENLIEIPESKGAFKIEGRKTRTWEKGNLVALHRNMEEKGTSSWKEERKGGKTRIKRTRGVLLRITKVWRDVLGGKKKEEKRKEERKTEQRREFSLIEGPSNSSVRPKESGMRERKRSHHRPRKLSTLE